MNPEDIKNNNKEAREQFLRSVGIDPKNQHLAVFALQQLQRVLVQRADEACVYYLRLWIPELRNVRVRNFNVVLKTHNIAFSALFKQKDPIKGTHTLIYGMARKNARGEVIKRAFELVSAVIPDLTGRGAFRLDVSHKEIEFPPNVKIIET